MATVKDPAHRNGARALRLAKQVIQATGSRYPQALAHLVHLKQQARAGVPARNDWPRLLRSQVRAYGYEPIFVESPVLYAKKPFRPDSKDPLIVLDYEDPERYPELYTKDVRGRTSHIQGEGIRLYSSQLARSLLELRKRHVSGRYPR